MSCPLSAILNDHDEAPQTTPGNASGPSRQRASSREAPFTAPAAFTSTKPQYTSRNRSSFKFSPEKGRLYDRRVRRKLDRVPQLLYLPPSTDLADHYDDMGPPSHELDFNKFSVFNALLSYSELTFEVIKYLEPADLLILYSTSRDFHNLVNTRFTTMILSQSLSKAPESSRIFPFRCYRSLCIRDPAQRANAAKSEFEVRYVPGFQWLQMILFRERTVDEIVACLEKECLMLPQATTLTIKKIWFTIDLPTNALRGSLIRNRDYWTDLDLYLANLFITKLDMLLTCPLTGEGDLGLRKMLLGQRSLATLAAVLKREEMRNEYEMLKMIVAWNYQPTAQQRRLNLPILGVKPKDIGMLQYEGWGANPRVMFHQIDTLVTMESVRRGLDMPRHQLDMVFYGFVDKGPGLDIWTMEQRRRMEEEAEAEAEREVGGDHVGDGARDEVN
ncbi:MAG: hypothetical protein Q9225_002369 [Loekoesia sp. 1 TL-2023]